MAEMSGGGDNQRALDAKISELDGRLGTGANQRTITQANLNHYLSP